MGHGGMPRGPMAPHGAAGSPGAPWHMGGGTPPPGWRPPGPSGPHPMGQHHSPMGQGSSGSPAGPMQGQAGGSGRVPAGGGMQASPGQEVNPMYAAWVPSAQGHMQAQGQGQGGR